MAYNNGKKAKDLSEVHKHQEVLNIMTNSDWVLAE